MDLAPITIGRKKTLFQSIRALFYAVVVIVIVYIVNIYIYDAWNARTVARRKHQANTELQIIQKNIFLLMGSQETFTLNLGQRIQEELISGRVPSAAVLQPYVEQYKRYNPALLVATLVQDGHIIARYPPDQSCDVDSTPTLLAQDSFVLGPQGEPLVSLDGPLYCEKQTSHLVNRLPIIVDEAVWAFLHVHYDFETFLETIGIGELNDEYRYSFLFSHPGGDETYLLGEAFDETSDPLTLNSSFSSLSWTIRILPQTLWSDSTTPIQTARLHALIGAFLVGLLILLIVRQYQRAQIIATTDSLTGAYNRRGMAKELQKQLRKKHPFCLVLIDVDDLKEINDQLGYFSGDAALLAVAKKILAHVDSDDPIARYGGDEFIILLRGCEDSAQVTAFYDAISPLMVQAHTHLFEITLSMGAVFYPKDGSDPKVLLERVDSHLKRAKQQGKRACFLAHRSPNLQ